MTKFDVIVNINVSLANAIRRTIISGINIFAIDTVCIKENDSVLCDEMINQRLAFIPLKKTTNEPLEDFEIKLNEIGPKRIYSKHIVFPIGIEPVSPDFIILDLGAHKRIDLFGTIEEGSAKDQGHSKFSVSCGTTMKKINDELIHIKVETTGSMEAKEVLIKAIQLIKEELAMYKKMM